LLQRLDRLKCITTPIGFDVKESEYASGVRIWFIIVSSSKIYPLLYESKDKFTDRRNFLLCESCHWCATSFTNFMFPNTCPLCSNNHIESMPISAHESYRLAYDYIHGLTLEFWFDSTTVSR
jgi:hypothetical protein